MKVKTDEEGYSSVNQSDTKTAYINAQHPNLEKKKSDTPKLRGCAKYLNRFDEMIMKPIFIYKYERNMQKQSKEFFELFMKQGKEIEKEFRKENLVNALEEGLKATVFHADKNSQGGFSNSQSNFVGKQFSRTRKKI